MPSESFNSDPASLPSMPKLTGFSQCFFVLQTLRSTSERLQRSLLQHYSALCGDCERKALVSHRAPQECCQRFHRRLLGIAKEAKGTTEKGEADESLQSSPKRFDVDEGIAVEDDMSSDVIPLGSEEGEVLETDDELESLKKKSSRERRNRARVGDARKIILVSDSFAGQQSAAKRGREDESDYKTKRHRRASGSSDRSSQEPPRSRRQNLTVTEQNLLPPCLISIELTTKKTERLISSCRDYLAELGAKRYKLTKKLFQDEYEAERRRDRSVPHCKFGSECYSGSICRNRHRDTLTDADKLFMRRLEEHAARLVVPKWLKIHPKRLRYYGTLLRECRQLLRGDFERALGIAEAYYKFEANRKFYRKCSAGVKCKNYFCQNNHSERTSDSSGPEFVIWVLDNYRYGFYKPEIFPLPEVLFPKCIDYAWHISYAVILYRYRHDLGVETYDRLCREIEELADLENKKRNREECGYLFVNCRFRHNCKYVHAEMLDPEMLVKFFVEMLKGESMRIN